MGTHIDIKALRTARGIGQRTLAKQVGVSAGAVVRWDKGSQPKADKLPVLVRVFGLNSVDELYT